VLPPEPPGAGRDPARPTGQPGRGSGVLQSSRTTSPTPSRRGLDPVRSGVPRQEAKGTSLGLRADDGADDRGAVAILRGVVGRVDGGVRVQGVSAKVTPRSMPLARIRPVPLACARRNEGLPDP
jgi:hypothetical protein